MFAAGYISQSVRGCLKENQDLISEILEKCFCFFICLLDRERFNAFRFLHRYAAGAAAPKASPGGKLAKISDF